MFCQKCGRENADDAVFCQKCGTMVADDEETRVARRPETAVVRETDEAEVFSITPTLMFVKVGYVGAALASIVIIALFAVFLPFVAIWIAIPLALAALAVPAYYHLRQRMVRYTLTDSKITIDEGFIFQNSRNIPLSKIQDVSVSSTVTQRMLGFGNLVIDNASEAGGKVILRNIDTPKQYADVLLKQIRESS